MLPLLEVLRWAPVVAGVCLPDAAPAGAAGYYLSPEGDDEAAGNRENPWHTTG